MIKLLHKMLFANNGQSVCKSVSMLLWNHKRKENLLLAVILNTVFTATTVKHFDEYNTLTISHTSILSIHCCLFILP